MTTAVQSMEISEKELEVRPNSISDVKVDASFRKVSKTAICFHIWKIDEDRLEAVSKTQFGTFYDDCAYILYASCMNGTVVTQDTITREAKSTAGLERFIHFWLGERVSAQKKANASHKVMELDSYFDNIATEYRESQDNESARFLSYFKNGMTVLSGALAAITPPCRLYQLQGREFIRCTEVEPINWDNFSSDYVMILNTETHLFLWNGRASSLAERSKSLDVARKLQQHRELVIIDDGYEQSMAHSRKTIWNAFLPLHQRIVNQLPRRNAKPQIFHFRLYSCRYKGSRYWFEQIKSTVPCQEDLQDSNCVYMLDGFSLGVWLWVGSQTAKVENIEAMRNGRGFIKKKKYPTSTSLVRVVEGHEPLEFTRFFPTWTERIDSASSKTKGLLGKFDSLILSQRPRMAAESQLIDDGTGERCVLRVNEDHLEEVPAPKQCIFFSDNCYIIEYTVGLFDSKRIDKDTIGIGKILYQWFGNECTQRAINKCERFAKERFGKLGEKSMLVQMNQGDETPHFLQIFAGRLTIINGDKNNNDEMNNNNNNNNSNNNHSNGNENNKTGNNSINQQLPETFALKVIGDASYNSFAIEMNPLVSMSYKECFVIKTHKIWVWCGQSSTGDARETAKNIGSIFGEITLIMEGKEPKEFWLSISENLNQMVVVASETSLNNSVNVNNKSSYPTSPTAVNSSTNGTAANGLREPVAKSRVQLLLIYISGGGGSGGSINAAGDIYTQEIFGFEQSDLCPENVYMLDTGKVIFVWLGERSPTVEQENYTKMVQFYLDNTPGSRRMTSALALVRQYNEPNVFKGFFNEWDHLFWSKSESYENKRKNLTSPHDLNAANQSMTNGNNVDGSPSSISNYSNDFDKHPKFPLQILQQETDLLPPEVSPVKREVYLTHDDFVALFNITYWEFTILPMWKQQDLKKKFKLF